MQPIVSGQKLYSAEVVDSVALQFQRERTSVHDEQASERAIYFGLMFFTLLLFNKERDRYPRINLDGLAKHYLSQCDTPMKSLMSYGTMIQNVRPQIEVVTRKFLIAHVEPRVTDKRKMEAASDWFGPQFVSGILFGQIVDYLTLSDYFEQNKA